MITNPYFPINHTGLRSKFKTVPARLLLVCLGCTLLNLAHSQSDKRLVLADQYFAAGEYYTAAHLYDQFLHPVGRQTSPSGFPLNSKKNAEGRTGHYTDKAAIQYKQAESYRLANYWAEASALYHECLVKDSAQYSAALYWYAVCQRSMGNYTVAEESIDYFLANNGGDTLYQQNATKEKAILQFIKSQIARPDSVLYQVKKMETLPGTKTVFAPVTTGGNNFLITSTQTDSSTLPGTNPTHNRLFYSTVGDNGLQNIEPVAIEGMDAALNQGAASLSADGNHLYFTQWKKENGHTLSSVYYATKKEGGWSQPMPLRLVNQEGYNSKQPFCSADGKYLFFASDRMGSIGGFDIWYAPLQADGSTNEPVNNGTAINTKDNEQAPFYHDSTNTLVFASDRMPGMGGYDLFASKGNETTWKLPENMGYPVNSSRDDVYFFAAAKEDLLHKAFISSDRGSECCLASYAVSKAVKKKIISGVVRDCKDDEPIANAEVLMKDALGKTFSTTTSPDGKYSFELMGNSNGSQLSLKKEKYSDKTADVAIEGSNKKEWLTDSLYAAPLCMEKKLVIKVENVVTVFFDFDQSKLKDRGAAQLDSIYNILKEIPTATLQISGYTDSRGSVKYNQKLSDKRAKACADYLIQKGVDAPRISFESFGACCPIEMEMINGRDNPDGRSVNRRALININKD